MRPRFPPTLDDNLLVCVDNGIPALPMQYAEKTIPPTAEGKIRHWRGHACENWLVSATDCRDLRRIHANTIGGFVFPRARKSEVVLYPGKIWKWRRRIRIADFHYK